MMQKISIGAPSLNGGACAHEQAKALVSLKYPFVFKFTNNMPRSLAIPQGVGLTMMPQGYDGDTVEVSIKKHDELLRVITDIQAIAELNEFKNAVFMSFDDGLSEQSVKNDQNQAKKQPQNQAKSQPQQLAEE